MNFEDMKKTGTNEIIVSDSLLAPLLQLKLTVDTNTTIPEGSTLEIYVDDSSGDGANRKIISYSLAKSLNSVEGISDEFIIEPSFLGNKVSMKAYIKRKSNEGTLLVEEQFEWLEYQPVILHEGYNKISTNYTNANLNIVYSKNSDLTKYFLTNTYTYGLNNEDKFLTLDDIYFKDCFTEVEPDTINADFNKLTIKCMNSENNNFSLDCEGNLVVNSITTKVKNEESSNIDFDSIYPVGSIYLSVNSANPGTLFGGTWEAFASGRTLVGFNANEEEFNTAGKMGGSKTVALTIEEMPSHKHTFYGTSLRFTNSGTDGTGLGAVGGDTHDYIQNTGGGQAHNNLQPYIVVYMWKRVA